MLPRLVQPADYGEATGKDPQTKSFLDKVKREYPQLIHSEEYDPYQGIILSKKKYKGSISLEEMGRILGYHCSKEFKENTTYVVELVLHKDGQTSSECFFGAQDAFVCADEHAGLDFSAELAVATSDIAQGCAPDKAIEGIRLVLLANHWTRSLSNAHDAGTAFGPVAVTTDELGDAWSHGRLHLTLQSILNGRKVGLSDTGDDMAHHFGELIAALARNRKLSAGSLVGSGTVRSPGVEKNGQTDWPKGYHSIADKRAMETQQDGQTQTDFLQVGNAVRIEVKGRDGLSVFGAIAQDVVASL